MNPVAYAAVSILVKLVVGSSLFSRVESRVIAWADKEISGAEKRHGVLDDLKVIGLQASKSLIRLAIELAVVRLKSIK